jgi:hypothetical protein
MSDEEDEMPLAVALKPASGTQTSLSAGLASAAAIAAMA